MITHKPEVLAPAGDFERLQAAVRYGADAVYLGGRAFGMRAASRNFDETELAQAVAHCHERGVRIYLTCNTLPRGEEVDQLPAFIAAAAEAGVDALIVADLGVLMLARRVAPGLAVHVSTQAGVVNHLTANELHRLGASRVILARELSLKEVAQIRRNTSPELEIEVFAHGAMCVSFSGRCLLSNYLTGRDGNRGACAQPCRWKYSLMEETRPGQYIPVVEEDGATYILNARDLCMVEHIPALCEAGVGSLKLEGRAKSAYYTAVITNAYRCAVDAYAAHPDAPLPDWIVQETRRVSHRDYCTGFYFGQPGENYQGGQVREWDVAAVVEGYVQGRLFCTQRGLFCEGDTLELLRPGRPPVKVVVQDLRRADGEPAERANHPVEPLSLRCSVPAEAGDILRRQRPPQPAQAGT